MLYFLRLGATGFGGPIALVGRMESDLVEDRGALAGAVVVLQRAVVDAPTILIAGASLVALVKWSRIPEPLALAAAGVAGVIVAG